MIRKLACMVVVSSLLGGSAVASDKWYGTLTLRYLQIEEVVTDRESEGSTSRDEMHAVKDVTAVR